MADALPPVGNGEFEGIELSNPLVQDYPKKVISCRAIDLHGKVFAAFRPSREGNVVFEVLIDGRPTRGFSHEYMAGEKFEGPHIGKIQPVAFTFPASARMEQGVHEVRVLLGKMVVPDGADILTTKPYPEWLKESPAFTIEVIEGEE